MRSISISRRLASALAAGALSLGAVVTYTATSSAAHADVSPAEAIQTRNDQYMQAWSSGDAAGVAALYSPDAVLFGADGTAYQGPDQIQGFAQGAFDIGAVDLTLVTTDLDVTIGNAFESGDYVLALADGTVIDQGTYEVYWRLVDGQWFYVTDVITSQNTPA